MPHQPRLILRVHSDRPRVYWAKANEASRSSRWHLFTDGRAACYDKRPPRPNGHWRRQAPPRACTHCMRAAKEAGIQ